MKVRRFAKSIAVLNCAVRVIFVAWDAVAGRRGLPQFLVTGTWSAHQS